MKVIQLYKDEKSLIKKALKGHRDAQRMLYEWHSPKMLSVCRYYIKDTHQAEEVMLNGFLKVFLHLKNYKSLGSFEGWIRRIMVRECISFIRQNKKVEFPMDGDLIPQGTSDHINQNMNVAEIQQLIDQLPEGYKMVFIMYAIEGYKHQEISEILNISEGTSKSQLFKARKMLQQQIVERNRSENGTT